MLKTMLKTKSKTLQKTPKPENSIRYGRENKKNNNHYKRFIYGLNNVMKSRQIKGRAIGAYRGARELEIAVRLLRPTDANSFTKKDVSEAIALATRTNNVMIQRDHGDMLVQFELQKKFWKFYYRRDVSNLGIGLTTRRKQVDFNFTSSQSQALIVGTTGSGKTVALQSSIVAMMETYPPDGTKFIVCDPHGDHECFDNSAHLLSPLAQSDSDIVKSLNIAHSVFTHRHNNNIRDDYQLVVVIDEITELIERKPELFDVIASLTNGRKFKINCLVAAHKVGKDALPGKDKYTQRFVGKTDMTDNFHATGLQGLEPHKLSGDGDFFYIAHGGANRFQVAMPTSSDFDKLERGFIQPDIEVDETPSYEFIEKNKKGGRPKNEATPSGVANYLMQNNNVSIQDAKSHYGYTRGLHNIHKNFTSQLLSELDKRKLTLCDKGQTDGE